MPICNTSFSYDSEDDRDIHQILSSKTRRDRSAYLRQVIRFYEANKSRLGDNRMASLPEKVDQVLALLRGIDDKLDQGVMVADREEEEGNGYLRSVIDQLEDF